jgi:hypothetical protein
VHGPGGEPALDVRRGGSGLGGTGERDEEGIALRVDLDAAVWCDSRAESAPMAGQGGGVPLAELVQQPRRAFDVRKEECDRAGGELAH